MPTLTVSWIVMSKIAARGEAIGLGPESQPEDVLLHILDSTESASEGSWSHSDVTLAEGTALKFTYLEQRFEGSVRDGLLEFDEVREESPSKAAALAIQARTGKSISINGWTTILAEHSSGSGKRWQKLADLRRIAQAMG